MKINLWDTGGEERFKALAPHYYKNANACILVYQISSM
jgi:GTPase SAR1 family protein